MGVAAATKPEKETKLGVDLGRLQQAIETSRAVLKPFRDKRRDAVRLYAGKNWSEDAAAKAQPINLLALYATIVGRKLVAKNPRVMMATFTRSMKPTVSAMEDWANKEIVKSKYAETMQRVALDALFSIGIGKVSLATPAEAEMGAYGKQAGSPCFSHIDLDDAVWDTNARCLDEASFVGHRYRVPIDAIKDSKLYASKVRKQVEPAQDDPYNYDGDQKISTLGRGADTNNDEFEDYAECWEIYLPRRGIILTLVDGLEEPLEEKRWLGPKCGPYYFLALGDVPGNSFPKAPVMDLVGLHATVNGLYRKLDRQANRQKTNLGVAVGADEDANRIRDANDGEVVRLDRPDSAKEFNCGGINQPNLSYAMHLSERFSRHAGNLDALGGLGPQSGTLGQDQMLEKNASSVVTDLQNRTINYAERVLRGLGWFWWNDPFQVMKSTYSVPGGPDISIERVVTPEQRAMVDFEQLDIDIDPYSMNADTPGSRLAVLMQTVMQVVMPMMPFMEKQGLQFDLSAFLKKIAKYNNMPDLEEIISLNVMPTEQSGEQQPGGEGEADYTSTASPNTQRTYVRENRSTKTPQGQDQVLMQKLAGGNAEGASQAMMNGAA